MKNIILQDDKELSLYCANALKEVLDTNPKALICIAAGNTSLGIFEELIQMNKTGIIDFSNASFVAMDEWTNMNVETKGSCSDFLRRNFIASVNFKSENVRYVDGCAKNPQKECEEIESYIEKFKGIDFLLLGCGMNGHLALNEPNTAFDSSVHCTELDAVTKKVGQKYFESGAKLEGGITIGIKQIIQAKKTILAINTESKKDIVQKIINEPISPAIPATVIRKIENAELVYNKAAAAAGQLI